MKKIIIYLVAFLFINNVQSQKTFNNTLRHKNLFYKNFFSAFNCFKDSLFNENTDFEKNNKKPAFFVKFIKIDTISFNIMEFSIMYINSSDDSKYCNPKAYLIYGDIIIFFKDNFWSEYLVNRINIPQNDNFDELIKKYVFINGINNEHWIFEVNDKGYCKYNNEKTEIEIYYYGKKANKEPCDDRYYPIE